MKLRNIKIAMTVGLLTMVFIAQGKTPISKDPSLKTQESMLDFLDQFVGLKKYLVSDEEFQNPKNALEISNRLQALAKAIKKTNHDPILLQENFKFSRDVLEDHVTETERVFRLGNKSYARWMTNSTLGICMGCHTQLPTQNRQFAIFTKTRIFSSNLDQAEFLFATKNFEGANKIYDNIIENYPDNGESVSHIEKSIQREISYLVRVKRDLKSTGLKISSFQKNKKLPDFLQQTLIAWNQQVNQWKEKKMPEISTSSAQEIVKFAEKNLASQENPKGIDVSHSQFISHLVVSGVLYEFLQKQPFSNATPDVLYWLSVIERKISNSTFFSLADLYLKECMLKYPENKMAIKCYNEYESEMVFGYTGTGGTNIPPEVLEDLKYLKKYVESKGKIPIKRSAP